MRFAFVPLLVVLAAFAYSRTAHAIETAGDLSNLCHQLEQGTKGNGAHIRIPKTSAALQCWGYMQAMQDLSVLVDENGNRLIGSCPPEQITVLQLIRLFSAYAMAHPGDLQNNPAVGVIKAFQQAFPCGQESASAQDEANRMNLRGSRGRK
jgi:hypothetical protein